MKIELYNIVDEFLVKYTGGTAFYDALDEEIRINDAWLHAMIQKVLMNEDFDAFVVSGKFGRRFNDFYFHNYEPTKEVLLANGALRKGNDIGIEPHDLKGKRYIFLDDSFWSGKTRNCIQEFLEANNGILLKSYVFYDGNKESKNVESFYRYYEFH